MKTIQLFVAAAVVALAASCSSKPAEPAAETPAVEETTPAPAVEDTTAVAPVDTTAAAQ